MKWFTKGILKHCTKLIYIEGRLKFGGETNSAPFDSIIAVFTKDVSKCITIEVWSNKA